MTDHNTHPASPSGAPLVQAEFRSQSLPKAVALDPIAFGRHPSKPSLEELASILRNPQSWPPGFIWVYAQPKCDALMLARQFWYDPETERLQHFTNWVLAIDFFDIPCDVAEYLFGGITLPWSFKTAIRMRKQPVVSPLQVADAIDSYLAFRVRDQMFNQFPANYQLRSQASHWRSVEGHRD